VLTPPPLPLAKAISLHMNTLNNTLLPTGIGVREEDSLAGRRGGWGVNILEDARHRIALLQ
jgi:hypothetical protein